jgi:hypothetical protein
MKLDETTRNSRNSVGAAGWTCTAGHYRAYVPPRRPLSWLDPSTLWKSRNDTVAKKLGDPVNDMRRAWMEVACQSPEQLVLDHRGKPELSFMVVGDPGEGDASQWATIPPLESTWDGTDFMVIMSDVIYPAGCVNEYEEKFYRPYRNYEQPIYGIPGNHDWYDELRGFMFHLCKLEGPPDLDREWVRKVPGWKRRLHRMLWRGAETPNPGAEGVRAGWRPLESQRSGQRTPYWTIELDDVRIVGIDTGIIGGIDREQGEWLRRVSLDPDAREKRKVLLTGKPLIVDGKYHPGAIEGGGTVDEIVRHPDANYVAAIGGDIHNYQRYPVKLPDGRTLQYIVAGGGGAFMHPTHPIPRVRLPGVDEHDFICYPRRGDSLSVFSKLYDRKLGGGHGFFALNPDEAAVYMARELDMDVPRALSGNAEMLLTRRVEWIASRIMPLPGRWEGPLHPLMALWFDLNTAPMFKSFLRIDARPDQLCIRCYAATGCEAHESDPPLEDEVVHQQDDSGQWAWLDGVKAAAAAAGAVRKREARAGAVAPRPAASSGAPR